MKKIALFASAVVMSTAMSFDETNDPKFLSQGQYTYNFESLPLKADLELNETPWASSFWPSIYGGIAFRWNGFHNTEPSFSQIHYNINDVDDEIERLNKELYSKNQSSSDTVAIVNQITNLKQQKRSLNYTKSGEHQKVLFSYARPRRLSDIRNMTTDQMYKLSPAEKFDVYKMMIGKSRGFTLTKKLLTKKTGPYRQYWEGICHGWSTAALEFKEPKPITVEGKGLKLTFNSSDLKGLLSQYHAEITRNMVTNHYGKRCGVEFPEETWSLKNGVETYKSTTFDKRVVESRLPYECTDDVDAGGFHIVLANQIALLKKGFVAEATRDMEVWNQPVFGYDSQILEEAASLYVKKNRGTAKQVRVKTIMKYANDGGRMYWRNDGSDDEFYAWENQTNGTSNYRSASKTYEYILDIDSRGRIIGGHWLSYERPDFLWIKRNKGFIKGTRKIAKYMRDLQNLVEVR